MAQRETRLKPLVLTTVGGVNERLGDTELPPHEYTEVEGVFPEFAGLQARMYGKRVLEKYPNAIYGIFQFWTPLGYAGGIVQFDGEVDFGEWLTPTTKFDLDLPDLDIDRNGNTVDEFGDPVGTNTPPGGDMCTRIETGIDENGDPYYNVIWEFCGSSPGPMGTPDDGNGFGGGQGKNCQFVLTSEDAGVSIVECKTGSFVYDFNQFVNLGVPPVIPPPPRLPLDSPFQAPSTYTITHGFISGQFVRISSLGHFSFETWIENQQNDVICDRAIVDFSGGIKPGNVWPIQTALVVQHTDFSGVYEQEHAVPVDYNDPSAVEILAYDLLNQGAPQVDNGPPPFPGGYRQDEVVAVTGVRYYYSERVCS